MKIARHKDASAANRVKISRRASVILGAMVMSLCVGAGIIRVQMAQSAVATETELPRPAEQARESEAARGEPVVVGRLEVREFEESIVAQGNIEAKYSAMVPARIPGTIERLFVDEGDCVKANETRLFQIDSLKLGKAVELARQDLAIARCAYQEKQANLERAEAVLKKAEIDYRRRKRLLESGAVGTLDGVEQCESHYSQALASVKHAKSLVALGKEEMNQAEAAVVMAEKDVSDTLVIAPISGTISHRFQEMGEMGDPGMPVFRIDDPTLVEVSAFLPSQYYPRVSVGGTRVRVEVEGIDAGAHPLSYVSPTIDPRLRTFEVKCLLASPPLGVAPGALATLTIVLDSRSGLGAPEGAVERRGDRDVVFLVDGGESRMVPVVSGLATDGWVMICALDGSGGGLVEGARVVTSGQHRLDDGMTVDEREAHDPRRREMS